LIFSRWQYHLAKDNTAYFSHPLLNTCIPDKYIRGQVGRREHPPKGEVSISVGLGQYGPEDTPDEITSRSDKALYAAKQAGKNTVKISPAKNNHPTT